MNAILMFNKIQNMMKLNILLILNCMVIIHFYKNNPQEHLNIINNNNIILVHINDPISYDRDLFLYFF